MYISSVHIDNTYLVFFFLYLFFFNHHTNTTKTTITAITNIVITMITAMMPVEIPKIYIDKLSKVASRAKTNILIVNEQIFF